MAEAAALLRLIWKNISMIGYPVVVSIASVMSPIQNKMTRSHPNPIAPLMMIDASIARGTLRSGSLISSVRWVALSYPGNTVSLCEQW